MNEWELWRQDDNGARFRIRGYADRMAAIAGCLVVEAGMPHKQLYWVAGPPTPTCPTPGVAAERIQALSADREPTAAAFLAAFRYMGASLRDDRRLEPDTVAALFQVAWEHGETGPARGSESDPACAPEGEGEPVQAPALDRARDHLVHAAAFLRAWGPNADLRRQDLLDLVTRVPH
ncbi:hypothetical protein ACFZBU_03310 [Embleya sp. NPDC008237]|uniref:hypothetical protein n=1 Tax=Embleya sp. NPDC008237 TaxID=3363978 RepID=UPI0036DFB161